MAARPLRTGSSGEAESCVETIQLLLEIAPPTVVLDKSNERSRASEIAIQTAFPVTDYRRIHVQSGVSSRVHCGSHSTPI